MGLLFTGALLVSVTSMRNTLDSGQDVDNRFGPAPVSIGSRNAGEHSSWTLDSVPQIDLDRGTLDSVPPAPVRCIHAISDVDDTLYALNLISNKWPLKHLETFTDHRFEEGTEYAGVRAFYRALREGNVEYCDVDESNDPSVKCDGQKVHIMSARQQVKGLAAKKLVDILGDDYDFENEATGDFSSGIHVRAYIGWRRIFKGEIWKRMKFAEVKAENFGRFLEKKKELLQAAPTNLLMFNGDNGQGDICAAQQMIKMAEEASLRMIITIHTVVDDSSKELVCDDKVGPGYSLAELIESKRLIRYHCYPYLAAQLAGGHTKYGVVMSASARDAVFAEALQPPVLGSVTGKDSKTFGMPQCIEHYKMDVTMKNLGVIDAWEEHPDAEYKRKKYTQWMDVEEYCKELESTLRSHGLLDSDEPYFA